MPKLCINGSECKFLKTPKGCKFLHSDIPAVKRRRFLAPDVDWRNTMGTKFYNEIASALKQANWTEECQNRDIAGKMTTMILDGHSYEQLVILLDTPEMLAEAAFEVLEILETNDNTRYVVVV